MGVEQLGRIGAWERGGKGGRPTRGHGDAGGKVTHRRSDPSTSSFRQAQDRQDRLSDLAKGQDLKLEPRFL